MDNSIEITDEQKLHITLGSMNRDDRLLMHASYAFRLAQFLKPSPKALVKL
jgi:hypothetical protein